MTTGGNQSDGKKKQSDVPPHRHSEGEELDRRIHSFRFLDSDVMDSSHSLRVTKKGAQSDEKKAQSDEKRKLRVTKKGAQSAGGLMPSE